MVEITTRITDTSDIHRRLLSGERISLDINAPQPGYYQRRLVKGGPMVPAKIWLEEDVDEVGDLMADQRLLCLVDGQPCDAVDQWTWLAGRPISREDYEFMVADSTWCKSYAPHEPKANPTKPINIRETKPVFPPSRRTA